MNHPNRSATNIPADPESYKASRHNEIGDVLVAQGYLPAALYSYKVSRAIRERLAKADPRNADWQRDLAMTHGCIGMAEARRDACDMALEALWEGKEIITRLKAQAPEDAGLSKDLEWFHSQIARVATELF